MDTVSQISNKSFGTRRQLFLQRTCVVRVQEHNRFEHSLFFRVQLKFAERAIESVNDAVHNFLSDEAEKIDEKTVKKLISNGSW